MKKKIIFLSVLASAFVGLQAQSWEQASQKSSQLRKEVDVKYAYQVDLSTIRNILKEAVETGKNAMAITISLPTAEGNIEKFAVYSNPVMDKVLADQYELGSYVGVGIDDPSKYVRFSVSPTEIQSMIIKDGVFQFIEPISKDKKTYGVFYKTKSSKNEPFECGTEESNSKDIQLLKENSKRLLSNVGITSRPANTKYRTYRLALSTTGEYTQHFDPSGGITNTLTQINATMTRVNGIFEKDFGVHLIIQDLPGIIYTDPSTDIYTTIYNGVDLPMNLQLRDMLTAQVGNANYDLGHLFHKRDSGKAGNAGGIGVICKDPNPQDIYDGGKGAAVSGSSDPSGDEFDILVAHEMGHQLGANHTYSMRTEKSGANVEPGSGSTVMSYAGITTDDIEPTMDGYFHYKSISQVLDVLESKPTCGIGTEITTNTPPVISPIGTYSIPKGTAYYLDAVATDAQNDPLKYTWEQYDSVVEKNSISGDSGWGYNPEGALARSYPGTTSGRRYFPKLERVMNGILTDKQKWETVSYIPRTLHYAVTVRDANAQKPMLSTAETTVTVGDDGPFKFNGLTTSSVLYKDVSNTIRWEVANTNSAPYNVTNVKIDYTTDNGVTWTDLVASTPNTGSYTAPMPDINGTVKLRVSAIGNVFYAISPGFTVGTAPTSTTAAPTGISTIDTEIFKTTARVSWNSVPGAVYSINYRKAGTTNWSNTTSPMNSVVLNNLEDETNYEVQVANVINSVPGNFSNNYTFKTKGLTTGIDYCLMTTGSTFNALTKFTLANLQYNNTDPKLNKMYLDLSEDVTKVINLTKETQYTASFIIKTRPNVDDWLEIWIDYNRNGIFEDSEKIASKSAYLPYVNGNNTYEHSGDITFTVPATADSGGKLLIMRVISSISDTATGPCDGHSNGTIRDFPIRISDNNNLKINETKETNSEILIFPNPADTFVEVKNLKEKADYKIYNAEGRLVQDGKLEGQKINIASLLKGMYIITINGENKTYNTKLIKK